MFIKRARPRPSVRAKETEDDVPPASSDGDASVEEGGSVMERKKAARKKTQGRSKLSFGGDDETSDSAFKQRKSLLSQALKASSSVASPSGASQSYSKEYLSELKAATPTRAPKAEGDGDGDGLSTVAQEKYASQIAADTTAGIPDPAAVAAAKNRRKAALEGRSLQEDYISLGSDRGPHPESRLMREEDEGEEGDEHFASYTEANDRLAIGREANRTAARRLRGEIGELIADREEEESDEETKEWEETLVARGGQTLVDRKVKKEQPKESYKPIPIPRSRPVPTVSAAEARIAAKMAELEVVKAECESTLESSTRDLVSLEEQERDIRKQVAEVDGKREWMEGFQGWVETLAMFLEEKVPQLDEIQQDQLKFIQERAALISKRRAADDADDLALFLGAPGSATSAEDMEAARPNSEVRRSRRKDRQDRRARRLGVLAAAEDPEEGFSTDSDLEGDVADDYEAAQNDLDRRVHSLLDDVKAEDFRDPTKGLAVRFAGWRERYPEDYNGAFGGLALVQAWEFWARGEMVGWEPVKSSRTLDSFTWFKALFNYSRPPVSHEDDDMDLEPEVGEEGDLSVEMVHKAVLPWLTKAFQNGAYDLYSARQTRRAVDLVETIGDMSNGTKEYDALFKTLTKTVLGLFQAHALQLASAIASATMPGSIPPPPYNPAARSAMQRFIRRRVKLIRNLLLWRRVSPEEVQDLISRYVNLLRGPLAKTWEGGGDEMAQKILDIPNLRLSPELQRALRQP